MSRIYERFSTSGFDTYQDFYKYFKLCIPEDFNFAYDVVDELAETKPYKCALLWTNLEGEVKTFTFADLKRLSNKAANFFTKAGIQKGDKVMLILKRRYEFWISMLAISKIGAVAIPATHLLTKKDIVYRNNKAGVRAIIATDSEEIVEHVDASMPESSTLAVRIIVGGKREGWLNFEEGLQAASSKFARIPTSAEDMMLAFFSSGTTGMPKLVAHNHKYPLAHIPTAVYWHNVDPEGIHLTVSDTGWGKCVWGKLYGQWLAETTVFVYDFDKFDPPAMLKIIEKFKITTFCAPPTIYRYFIKEELSKYDLSSLRYVTTAGEALNLEVFEQFERATGLKIREGFGQTETVLALAHFVFMREQPGSLGRPSPLFKVDIVDEDGRSCTAGETGEIVIYGKKGDPGLMMEYYEEPDLTERVWHDGVFHTGDTAWKDERGCYWYVGRVDDVIKSSGYRVGPFEVESALMEHPSVLEVAVTGVPDPVRGQLIKATVVLARGFSPSEGLKKELQTHVKNTTAPYKYPRVVEFVESLPKTISGKIRRKEIRDRDWNKES